MKLKIKFSLLLMLLLINPLFLIYGNEVDSLLNRLLDAPKAEKASIYLQLAKEYLYVNYDSSEYFSKLAVNHAEEIDNIDVKALGLKNLGSIYFLKGIPSISIEYYNQAAELFLTLGNFQEQANIYNNMALLMQKNGELKEALHVLNKALAILKSNNDIKLLTGPYLNIGSTYHRMGNYTMAEIYYDSSYTIALQIDDPVILANNTNNLFALYKDMAMYDKALEFFELTITNRRRSNDKNGEAMAWHNLGNFYNEIGEYSKAIEFYNKGLSIRKEMKAENQLLVSYLELGKVYVQWGKFDIAADYFYLAHEIALIQEDNNGIANSLFGLAEVNQNQLYFDKALDMYKNARELFIKENNVLWEMLTVQQMALLYMNQLNQVDVAKKLIDNILPIIDKLEDKTVKSELYFTIAMLNKKMNNYDKAIKNLQLSLSIISNNKYSNYRSISELAELYRIVRQQDSSIAYYSKALVLSDEVASDKYNMAVAKAEALFHWDKKQYEIDRLESKETVYLAQAEKRKIQLYFLLSLLLLSFAILCVVMVFLRKLRKAYGVIEDERQEIEAQADLLQQTNVQLTDAKSKAESHSRFKSEFLAHIGHELRTPVNAVLGYARLVRSQLSDSRNLVFVDNIIKSANTVTFMLNDLQDLSKIEAGKITLEKRVFNPIEVISHSINELKFMAEEKQINFSIHFEPFLPQQLVGDSYRLYQVLTNLISNAIKYSYVHQEVIIEADSKSIEHGHELIFKVIDKGVGIPADKLHLVFESFTRLETPGIESNGMGLGLTVVKKILNLQRGNIKVESTPGEGSVFTVTIPYAIPDKEAKNKEVAHREFDVVDSHEVNILVVEDNIINQELVKDTIESWGKNFHICIAENGMVALDQLKQKAFDIVLMDIQMPILDGFKTAEAIRNDLDEPVCFIPIIGLTAYNMNEEKEHALKVGMDDYIVKPFNPDELKEKILFFLNRKFK